MDSLSNKYEGMFFLIDMYKTPWEYALFRASDNWKSQPLCSAFLINRQPIRIQNPRNWEESDRGTLDIDPPGSHLGHQPLGEDHGSFHFAVHNRLDWDVGKRQHNVERHKHIDDHSHFGPCIDGIVGRTSVIRSIFSHSITGKPYLSYINSLQVKEFLCAKKEGN